MLARLLRSVFAGRRPAAVVAPTPQQARLLEAALAALACQDAARLRESRVAIARAGPPCAEVHRRLGSEAGRRGRLEEAREELEAALALDGSHAGAWADLGNVHRLEGQTAEAERCYRQALAIDPAAVAVGVSLAALEADAGRSHDAVERLRAIVNGDADSQAVAMLARLFERLARFDEAKSLCLEVLARRPSHGAAHAALGYLLLKREHRPAEALAHFDAALAAGHRTHRIWSNRGIALQDLGRLEEALASYDEALTIEPSDPLARFHKALTNLMRQDYARAWPDYEARLVSEDQPCAPRPLPVWDGSPTTRKLLVYGEQGIGDEIMFSSCIPDLSRRCPNVVLACTPKLRGMFSRSFPGIEVVTLAQARDPATPETASAACTIAIGSLPLHFRSDRTDFPLHRGYLRADPALVVEYRERLQALGPELKVGLSWRGGLDRTRRATRSIALEDLASLLQLRAVRFVNLQYDSRRDEASLASEIASGRIVHWQDALDDYERTAALVASLDLVVSVCTAAIHLAGALGVRTRILAPFSPEWRYGIAGDEMPWYPSVRIERQPAPGLWTPVIDAVRDEVRMASDSRGAATDEPLP